LPRGQDLHQEGRRRQHLALVRRPRPQAPRPHRGLRLARRGPEQAELAADILRLQDDLFVAGAELATAPEAAKRLEDGVSRTTEAMVAELERLIDRYMDEVELPPKFVIPGGNQLSAQLDVARTVVRRAERHISALNEAGDLAGETVIHFVNRTSDLVYAMARWADVDDPALFEGRGKG
jgi:cob(I)alamin adenosyltransferase